MLMNRIQSLGRVAALLAAMAVIAPLAGEADDLEQGAGADCFSIGQQVAAENGGTLAKASAMTRDGQTVCVIVVLVPGKEGQRPRRAEFVVAAQ
jgi:hypothetical protein